MKNNRRYGQQQSGSDGNHAKKLARTTVHAIIRTVTAGTVKDAHSGSSSCTVNDTESGSRRGSGIFTRNPQATPRVKEVNALQGGSSLRHDTITSLQNPKIKEVTALQSSSSLRREKGLFVVEGLREVQRCLESGFCLRSLFYCPVICPADSVPGNEGTRIFEVSENVYRKMAYREGTEGLLAVVCGSAQDRSLEALDEILFGDSDKSCPVQEHSSEDMRCAGKQYSGDGNSDEENFGKETSVDGHTAAGIQFPLADHPSINRTDIPLIVVIESVEKPGNLGAMLRTADASGVSAVLICDPRTDLYNPNLIRASLGGVFTRNIAVCTSSEAITWLKGHGISILTAQLQDSELYYDTDMTRPTAIVFGTEADGLSDIWRQAADAHIRIPMTGSIDSLNVSASMAVLCYEALRQRHIGMPASEIFSDTTTGTSARTSAGITGRILDRTNSVPTAYTPETDI